jgi:hypothetical protein
VRIPLGDWQFWLVTAIFLIAAGYLFRAVLPIPYFTRRHRLKRSRRRVSLTVKGRSVK